MQKKKKRENFPILNYKPDMEDSKCRFTTMSVTLVELVVIFIDLKLLRAHVSTKRFDSLFRVMIISIFILGQL